MPLMSFQRKKINKKNNEGDLTHTILEFFKISKDDLKISKLLYKKKYFAASIYHLQQSVEKLTKAYLLKTRFIDRKDLSKISHKTPKGILKILEDESIKKDINILEKISGTTL